MIKNKIKLDNIYVFDKNVSDFENTVSIRIW